MPFRETMALMLKFSRNVILGWIHEVVTKKLEWKNENVEFCFYIKQETLSKIKTKQNWLYVFVSSYLYVLNIATQTRLF